MKTVDEDEGSPPRGGAKPNVIGPKSNDQRKPSGSATSRHLFPPNKTQQIKPPGNWTIKLLRVVHLSNEAGGEL